MSKRKSSGLGNSEDDDSDGHCGRKIFKFEIKDECSSKNQRDKSKNYTNFISQDKSETEKKGSVKGRKNIALDLMYKYGYKDGSGIGKLENGIIEPVQASQQKGKRGLGFQPHGLEKLISEYDPEVEDEIFDEEIIWLINDHLETINTECLESWVKYGSPLTKLSDDSPFCEASIISDIIQSKNVLDNFTVNEKKSGRRRSNPFESIHNAIFLNRAAMKMANMDAILDKMFTEPKAKTGEKLVGPNELLYFADVCAGPGGFSEYVLYRKRWLAKGFGFTLKNENDFKLDQFIAGPSESFEPHYGITEDGDIFVPENIISFRNHVMEYTDNIGVHFMMADGGIPIEKDLCEQEIKCKKLYLCQCIVALLIVRPGGHFVVKLFDLFTEFSVGLVYLMYRSFEEILILKPKTSRPANSERYLICKWKRSDCRQIADHLFEINVKVPRPNENPKQDVLELVPTDVLENDEKFINYIRSTNKKFGKRQIKSLLKMAAFSENTELTEPRQQSLRKECLKLWDIPDEARAELKSLGPRSKWMELVPHCSLYESEFCSKKNKVTSLEFFNSKIENKIYSWLGVILCQEESNSTCTFYLGLGKNNTYRYSGGKWVNLSSIALCLPANTIVYGEVVPEFVGAGKSQTKIQAFHIIDGLVLGGEDIRHQPFQKRRQMCALFAKALLKKTFPVRVKNRFLLANIEELWSHLVLKQIKSSRLPSLAISVGEEDRFYKATGVMFIKEMGGCWNRYLSKTHNLFFVDNAHQKIFEQDVRDENLCKSVYADFEKCFHSRLIWWWDEGVIVHEGQNSCPDSSKMQKGDIMRLINCVKLKRVALDNSQTNINRTCCDRLIVQKHTG